MKIINEDIANIERALDNEKVNIVGSMPLVMADAVVASEKTQEAIDKEMEQHNKNTRVKLNKVVGAEKQPVPDLPEEAKSTLDESLFESLENGRTDSKEAQVLDNVFAYLRELMGDDEFARTALAHFEITPDELLNFCDIDVNELDLNTVDENLTEARSKEDRDLFTQIMDDLSATNYNMKNKSKFPNMNLADKYEDEDLGIDYKVDGYVDITVRQDDISKFDFAKQVADAYEVEYIEAKPEGSHMFKAAIRIPEED